MSARLVTAGVVLACMLTLSSCLLRKPEAEKNEEVAETVLSVENRHWADVTVYVMRGNARVRMGTVTSSNTIEFVIPAVLVNQVVDIRLVADPVGDNPFTSEPVTVAPGDHIEFRVANVLRQTSIWVWE